MLIILRESACSDYDFIISVIVPETCHLGKENSV